MNVINLTPHPCVIFDVAGTTKIATLSPSGQVARVKTAATASGSISVGAEVPVVETTYGNVEGLPEPQDGAMYIVSVLVVTAQRMQGVRRADVVAPDTGPDSVVRDADGKIVGVRRFTR